MTTSMTPLSSAILGPEIGLVPDHDPYRQEFRRWLADNSPGLPEPLDLDERFAMQRDWQRVLFDGGWAGPAWPETS
jgi:alkylation response protein AidB-like acyl-CoA dehydrogenase